MGSEANNNTSSRRIVIILLVVIVCLVCAFGGLFIVMSRKPNSNVLLNGSSDRKLAYAEGVTIVDDADALQKAVDEMYAKAQEGNITLEYKNDAFSTDGTNFDCYIANAVSNSYDMYIDIYADDELTDEVFLSGLMRPGEAFRELTLTHPLESGTNTVYVAFTQMEEDLQTIHAQIVVTMDFHVD